ncbi:MAG: alanyl-tRNA editing protein [Candidatus Riflebacteria bacterium]|nr:alanyl-tRNA editing protein [Candidatus Riflebacteria bacterium]
MTVRLYYQDPYLFHFRAKVLSCMPKDDSYEVLLDRTCFYPESGGQPCDGGTLGGRPVVSVREEGDRLVHVLDAPVEEPEVEGLVDEQRRRDHMEQHTGQHLLSAAFLSAVGVPTVSMRIGEHESTIDLDRPELFAEDVEAAEDLANRVIREDRAVHCFYPSLDELEQLTLRKRPAVEENVRIVRVPDYDCSPCGGTHCPSTGRVGVVKVRRWEHYKGMTRVTFLAGGRALADHRVKNDVIWDLTGLLSVRDRDLPARVKALVDGHTELERQVRKLRADLLRHAAPELLASAPRLDDGTLLVVHQLAPGYQAEDLKVLAECIVRPGGAIFLGGLPGPKAQLLFARSADRQLDVGALLKKTVAAVGGKGGGTAAQAQGGVPGQSLGQALEAARLDVRAAAQGG